MKKKQNNQKIYEKIINNRYKISIAMILLSTIVGFFVNSMNLKEFITSTEKFLSLWWNIKFYALVLASYELFYIITNGKRAFSLIGTGVICLSGFVQFNFINIDCLILGEIITVLIFKIITKENFKLSLFVILFSVAYVYTFRPYAISFGYIFISLIIFELIHNRNILKNNKNKILLLIFTFIISVLSAIIAGIFSYNNNEIIYNAKFGISGLFSYLYNPLLPFNDFKFKQLLGSFISGFPIPIVIGLCYLYKNNKHADFLLPIIVVTVLETIFCISGLTEVIEKITMFYGIEDLMVMPAVNLANVFIIFYIISNIDEQLFKMKHAIRITLIMVCVLAFLKYPNVFSTNKIFLYLFAVEITALTYMMLNYSDKRYQKVLMFILLLLTVISGVPINFIA